MSRAAVLHAPSPADATHSMTNPDAHIATKEAEFLHNFYQWIDTSQCEEPATPDLSSTAEFINPLPVFIAPEAAHVPPLPATPAPFADLEVLPQLEPFPVVRGLSFDDFHFVPPSPCPSLSGWGTDVSSAPSTLPPATPSTLAASPLVLVADAHMDHVVHSDLARLTQSPGNRSEIAPHKREGKKPAHTAPQPFPASHTRRARPFPSPSASTARSLSSGTSAAKVTPRRNRRVDPSAALPDPPAPSSSRTGAPLACPYCPKKWDSKKKSDFRRHVQTHTGQDGTWVCCGVPVELAAEHGYVPPSTKEEEKDIRHQKWVYAGMQMVGGCHWNFSRKDALKRHLDSESVLCTGDSKAVWIIGNQPAV